MILLKVTNEQLLSLSQDVTFKDLVSSLTVLQAANSARGKRPENKEGWIEIGESYMPLTYIAALASNGVEFKDIPVYVEVQKANFNDNLPGYLPDATKEVIVNDVATTEPNTWLDKMSRTALDGSKIICGLGALNIDQITQLMGEAKVTAMNVQETRNILVPDYETNDVV